MKTIWKQLFTSLVIFTRKLFESIKSIIHKFINLPQDTLQTLLINQ